MSFQVGIIILNYNTWEDTIACVDSIIKTATVSFRIYVVDNKSTDDSFQRLVSYLSDNPSVCLVLSPSNNGFSAGNNVGIKQAISDGAETILVSNADIVFREKTIDELVHSLKNDDSIGIIGPDIELLNQKTNSDLCRRRYNTIRYMFSKKPLLFFRRFFKSVQTEIDLTNKEMLYKFDGMVSGCCFLIRTDLLRDVGLLDEVPFLYYEEMILAYKMESTKYCTAINRAVSVLHKEMQSTSKIGTGFQSFHLYLSGFYYLKKYAKASFLFLFVLAFSNVVIYGFRSIYNAGYRKMFRKFISFQKDLLFHSTVKPIR